MSVADTAIRLLPNDGIAQKLEQEVSSGPKLWTRSKIDEQKMTHQKKFRCKTATNDTRKIHR